jgi:ketosteroid isomerase-like protein
MGEESYAAMALRLWEAISRGDSQALRGLMAPEIEWSTLASGSLTGKVVGGEAVIEQLARIGETVESLRSEMIDISANPTGAVIHSRVTAERFGKRIDTHVQLILEIEGGRIARSCAMPFDPGSVSKFWVGA